MIEKIAPVQGYVAGIPWSMHLRAYDAYCKKYGPQEAMIDLEGRGCRGGFGVGELDMFIPGWRDELSEINRLKSEIERLREALAPFAAFAEKAEAFVEARAKDGGSPILPSTDFRLADFRRARAAIAEAMGPVASAQSDKGK